MLSLRGQITMLDNFVIQEESISPMIATLPTLPVNTEVNADVITEVNNLQKYILFVKINGL